MRRIVIWFAATVTVVVLLFGYHTSTNRGTATATPPGASTPPTSTGTGASSAKSYTGSAASTRWGPVQVKITVAAKTITAVDVVQYPNENPRDQEINADAIPRLVQETIEAQSADIDMISGATVTSDGYLTSLQSALDAAGW